jgi:hypothetical protein
MLCQAECVRALNVQQVVGGEFGAFLDELEAQFGLLPISRSTDLSVFLRSSSTTLTCRACASSGPWWFL